MRTIIVDLLNPKSIQMLESMEALGLIRLRKRPHHDHDTHSNHYAYKQSFFKQSIGDLDEELEALRRDWE